MKSFEQLAKSAYEAHCKTFFEKNLGRGIAPPVWAFLGASWQACWIAAAKKVVEEVQAIH